MKRRFLTLGVIIAISGAAVALVFAQPRTRVVPEEPGKMPDTYSIKTFLNPNWETAMHEVFTHYLQAANTFGQGDYEMTISFLKVMEFYVDFLPGLIPSRTPPPDSRPINKTVFRDRIRELKRATIDLRRAVEMKNYSKATNMAPDIVTNLCFECHKKAKVPPKWQMGGYKID